MIFGILAESLCAIAEAIESPATRIADSERHLPRYAAWLDIKLDERLFAQPFGLRELYVEPRGYDEVPTEQGDETPSSLTDIRTHNKLANVAFSLLVCRVAPEVGQPNSGYSGVMARSELAGGNQPGRLISV